MIKKENDKYIITTRNEINKHLDKLKTTPIKLDIDELYYAVKNRKEKIMPIDASYTAEELIVFYQSNFTDELLFLHKYCDFEYFTIMYLLPPVEALLLIPKNEAEKILEKHVNYDMINMFCLKDLASKLKKGILEKPHKCDFFLQRFGLIPIEDFSEKRPPENATIFYVRSNNYFTSHKNLEIHNDFQGVSEKYKKSALVEITDGLKKNSVKLGTGRVFETVNGKLFRELKPLTRNFINSAAVYGYNRQFTVTPQEPFDIVEDTKFHEKYMNIILSLNIDNLENEKEGLTDKIISLISSFDFGVEMNKILQAEFRTNLHVEFLKIANMLKNSATKNDFKLALENHQKNFILGIFNKLKIYEQTKKISRKTS